jgi:EmrB/QacA subfamily drug resistance transporter
MRNYPTIFVTILVAGAFFMENLDGTIIATALPQMAGGFHTSAVTLNIGITSYLATLAIFIPVSGWVADRFGGRLVFASAISIFTLASVLCGISQTLTQFTLLRILQGVGGAMMVPVGRLIVLRAAHKNRLTQAIAYITWPALTALVVGPPLGGFITTYFGWRWIFFLNLPLGFAALVLTFFWVDNAQSGVVDLTPFDWPTFLFAGLTSIGGIYALEELGRTGVPWEQPVVILFFSLVSGAFAILNARRSPHSPIDLESMRIKSYRLSIYGASGFRIAVSVLPFILPLMFQIGFHLSALASGTYLLALFAGDLSMKAFIIQALRRFGFRRILIVNGIFTAASIALCATLEPGTRPIVIVSVLFLHGAGRSLEFTCLTTLAYTEIEPIKMSRANGFLSAVNQLSLGVGVAVGAVTLRIVAHTQKHLSATPKVSDFHIVILCVAVLALSPVFDSLDLDDDAGALTSGHLRRPLSTRKDPTEP